MDLHVKLSFSAPEYSIDGTTTTCRILVTPSDSLTVMPFYSEGVAKLKPGDTYDEKIGLKVSLAKAESHAYRLISSLLKKEIANLLVLVEAAEKFIDKSNRVCEHNKKYIDQF